MEHEVDRGIGSDEMPRGSISDSLLGVLKQQYSDDEVKHAVSKRYLKNMETSGEITPDE